MEPSDTSGPAGMCVRVRVRVHERVRVWVNVDVCSLATPRAPPVSLLPT